MRLNLGLTAAGGAVNHNLVVFTPTDDSAISLCDVLDLDLESLKLRLKKLQSYQVARNLIKKPQA